ncbi:Putative Mg2+ and Co2+ transporter CorB [Aedoeadaptatus ivorii]|uniref:Mg2+ and Co2+ transporter CorB n=1 Tax=Aedoeadaptatus ivorii TaxID=54006 RepID=A0A448V0G9_9FIRM|nr:hemolysin family protein [Peptoniphilus ivorii]MDQ0508018.1 putative hemolysin [Peptoniphilus ivorii]VEJ34896.1 Putative Mg2+ and Co2+ transporter CorB [Peptoniphilus ivorii]
MDSIGIYGVVIVLLTAASAFFSSSETALLSANQIRLRQAATEGDKSSLMVLRLLEKPQDMISSILIGNNIVNIASSAVATVLFTRLLGASGPVVATAVMTVVVLVFGEVMPKTVAQEQPELVSKKIAKPISVISVILKPAVFLLGAFTTWVNRLLFPDVGDKPTITEEEFKTLVEVGEEEGVLESAERTYIDNVLDFSSATASDMMKPRTSVVALDVEAEQDEILALLRENRYSRVPVYRDSIDNIIGILYMKDVVRTLATGSKLELEEMLRDPYFIGESAVADRIFREMKARNLSIAVVVDEYAGTSGIITMEDILEELVGNIDDEYDLENRAMILLDAGVFLIDPELRIDEVNDHFRLDLESEKSDSIGGFVIEQLDRIPKVGEVIRYGDIVFTVNEMQGLKLTKLKMDLRERL